MRNSIYISNQTSVEILKKYQISQAAFNFNNHINSLEYFSYHYGIPTTDVGVDFKPYYDKDAKVEYYGVRLFRHDGLGRTFNILLENIGLYLKVIKRKEKNVWFYNLWTNTLILYLLIRFFSFKKTYILLADYNPHRSNPIVDKFILWCHQKARAILSLSARCSETNKRFYSIPGIIPEKVINKERGTLTGNHNFLFSGAISKDNGINMVLDVFSEVPEANVTITGIGGEDVKEKCLRYPNINCLGYLENYEDYLRILSNADYLLSWRDPSKSVNHYNFPSKILETLAGNRTAVISTIKYEELDGVNYLYEDFDKDKLVVLVRGIVAGKYDDQTSRCLDNSNMLIEKYSEKAWINAFEKIEKTL